MKGADLVLLDVQLPDITGFEVVRRVHSEPADVDIRGGQVDAHRARGVGTGGPGYTLPAEIHRRHSRSSYVRKRRGCCRRSGCR